MKWIIASDIHGSEFYCKKLIDAYHREKAERILLLGDLLYHGPRNNLPEGYNPKGVIAMLNGMKDNIYTVRGNCDADVDQMVLEIPIMADYCLIPVQERLIFATHGHIYHEQNMPAMHDGDVFLYGHTHVPRCEKKGNYIFMNPGSVSLPKEGSHHGYMVLEDGLFTWKDFDGTVKMQYQI